MKIPFPPPPSPASPPPIPPADPRHHRFALNVLNCHNLTDSYLLAGFECKRTTAYVNSSRLIRRPDVAAYIAAVRPANHAWDEAVGKAREAEFARDFQEFRAKLMR